MNDSFGPKEEKLHDQMKYFFLQSAYYKYIKLVIIAIMVLYRRKIHFLCFRFISFVCLRLHFANLYNAHFRWLIWFIKKLIFEIDILWFYTELEMQRIF